MSKKTCLYFTTDLMFTSRVQPIATESGYELKFPGFEDSSFESAVDLVIFDLGCVSGEEIENAMVQLRAHQNPVPTTVAYGPHVKKELLATAEEKGVQLIWTRGQFSQQFPSLFAN